MKKHPFAFSHSAVSLLVIFSLLTSQLAAIYHYQPQISPDIEVEKSAAEVESLSPSQAQGILFRTHITFRQPQDLKRVEKVGAVVLESGEDWALLLVTSDQLETLARLRFQPQASDSLDNLARSPEAPAWLEVGLRPILAQAAARQKQAQAGLVENEATAAEMAALLNATTPEQRAALASVSSIDDDGDGLTNLEEAWWCTDPLNPNSDGDAAGYTDGEEVTALLDFTLPRTARWGYGPPFGPPNAWPDFNGSDGDPNTPACNDGDWDTIPDFAEAYVVGSRVPAESTDNDKFDDGQELFGVTYCPGAPTNCGYGSLPAGEYWNYIKETMPNWVEPPGDNIFVAAFPIPEVSVVPGSWKVDRVTTITTQQGQMTQATNTYETSVTDGQSTSIANSVTWNDWEEVSESIETPVGGLARLNDPEIKPGKLAWGGLKVLGGTLALATLPVGCTIGVVFTAGLTCAAGVVGGVVGVGDGLIDIYDAFQDDVQKAPPINIYNSNTNINNVSANAEAQATAIVNNNIDFQGVVNSLDGVQYAINQQGQLLARGLYDISYAISRPRYTETRTNGRSWGGAQTTTNEVYEEHTISQGEAFTTGQNWSTAWAVDSSHAADLTFNYVIENTGTEYAREISGLIFNIYLGDDPTPLISYPAWQQFANGKIENIFPGDKNNFASTAIPLTLEQMKRIDLGQKLTVVLEDFSYGVDELFYQNATTGGVTFFIEDGVEDGDETVDMYVLPTWGVETVQDVLGRYFPMGADAEGNINSLWTPEFNGTGDPAWNEHYLSDIAWWNIYLTQPGAGNTPLNQLAAAADSALLFRFNRDSDRDGYQDRVEWKYYCGRAAADPLYAYCADGHLRPEIHPQPEIVAGYTTSRVGNEVTVLLSIANLGTFDAYGIDAVMYAPDNTTTIGNNTVGGNGRVRPGQQVSVGSLIRPPDTAGWTNSTATVYAAGDFTGSADKTITFTVNTPGTVGSGSTALNWTDGGGITGTLALGSSYQAPLPVDVVDGIQVGFDTGAIISGDAFAVSALTPRDTFTFTVNSDPYTPPVIVVSTSDPQGSHRFVTPVELTDLNEDLTPYSGQMLRDAELMIATQTPVAAGVTNTIDFVFNNPHPAAIENAHLYLNFVADGQLVAELPYTMTLPTGPTTYSVDWSTDVFSQTFDANADNILIAFWTDAQNNIIDADARPLPTFQDDPQADFAMNSADLAWDFGAVNQGTLLQKQFVLGSVGFMDLLTYIGDAPGISLQGPTSTPVSPADMAVYTMTINTASLPAGPFSQSIPIRTSDPQNPAQTLTIQGTILAFTTDSPPAGTVRPLDWPVTVPGPQNQGSWYTFNHTLGPTPQTLHPVKVYSQDYGTLWGVGKYATDFGQGTASYDMFGDGSDGDLVVGSGQTVFVDTIRTQLSNSVAAGANTICVGSTAGLGQGDEILVIQMQGIGVGNYEFHTITNINTCWLTLKGILQNPYSATNSKAQVLRVPNYKNVTIQTGGTLTANPWNGVTGGIVAFRSSESMIINGLIDTSGLGFRNSGIGGIADREPGGLTSGQQGEGINGLGIIATGRNGNGGGGGSTPGDGSGGGGGGGNATFGTNGQNGQATGGTGGNPSGNATLTNITFGGEGGGAGGENNGHYGGGHGGNGGGIIFLFAKTTQISGSLLSNGNNGSNAIAIGGSNVDGAGGGGGGAGGSIFVQSESINLGTNRVVAIGGNGGSHLPPGGSAGDGGAGSTGRIRIEYCDTLTGATNPVASTQKLDCYIVEQVETSPYTQGRLNLPETIIGSQTYAVQYGRRLSYTGSGQQTATLRVPANATAAATLDALISGVSGSVTLQVDVGSDGSWEWQTTQSISGAAELTSVDLSAAFNDYWAAQGYPTSGNLDTPVTVSLNQAGQVLLTNLQMTPAGSTLRYARTPADSYASWLMNLTVDGSGSGPLTIAADVGDDGSVEWAWSGTTSFPASLTTGDLATAVNSYLSGQNGDVDVPVRFYLAPFASLTVNGIAKSLTVPPDASLTAGDISFSQPSPMETDVISVTAVLNNLNNTASGGVTAAFFATAPGGSEWYIGSDFIPDIPANGSAAAAISWNTNGYTGTVPVRVQIDPYNRLAESSETNNEATQNLTIRSRPDLQAAGWPLSDAEPIVGETVAINVNLLNGGQTASGTAVYALYNGNPDNGGVLLDSKTGGSLSGGGSGTVTLTWTPTAPGPYQLFLRLDTNDVVNEYDESNNLLWQDVHVGLAGPILLDSGVAGSDPAYTSTAGYGYVDTGQTDVLINCGGSDPEDTLRRDPDGSVGYRFDYLQPGHFYHLDITLYECDGAGRQESILVDGNLLAGPEDLGDGAVHKLSLRLDPALYADRSINVSITAPGIDGAVAAAVNLHDIDYRYADAGGSADPAYAGDYGWLDGVANNAWGNLPYQSVRVDQNDNQISYQFDNLDPAKRYNVLLTFWQGSGAARIQKVRIDGLETGLTVDSGDFQRHDETIAAPVGSYANDGSIVVSIIRLNASSGAMVNEIALEEETLSSSADCQVQTTPFFTQVYGNVLLAEAPAAPGTVVQAINPRGDTVGCFAVTNDGLYGFMRIYGEDNSANPPIPGMRPGELVSFKVSGSPAVATPLFYWQDDKASYPVDLNASAMDGQFTLLAPGWNWLSLQVEPPTPLVAQTFSSINGRYDRVLGEVGIYDTSLPPVFNSLSEIRAGLGYMMRITGTASVNLLAEGIAQAPETPIPLHQGWNWVGYLPTSTLPVATALQSIAGQYQLVLGQDGTYDPALPAFSTLQEMNPGEGYLIYANTAVTLTYPAPSQAASIHKSLTLANGVPPTPYFTIAYGKVRLNEKLAPPGTVVEATTPRGDVAGRFVIQQPGVLGFISVYGEDGEDVPLISGFREGEEVIWRVNGIIAKMGSPIFWQNDWATHPIELDLFGYWVYLPVIQK